MRGRRFLLLLPCLCACSSESEEEETITATRIGDTLEVIGKNSSEITLRIDLRKEGAQIIGTVMDTHGVGGAIGIEGDVMPRGTIDAGNERLELAASDAKLAGASIAYGAALEGALESSELTGALLRRLLPLHRKIRALLPETRGLFRVAALAHPTATADLTTWPEKIDFYDKYPTGQRDGDVADVGMSCNANIICPSHAPICSTSYSFCTRACLDEDDCPSDASCLGATGGEKFCFYECAGGGPCVALLECTGRTLNDPEPTICAGAGAP